MEIKGKSKYTFVAFDFFIRASGLDGKEPDIRFP